MSTQHKPLVWPGVLFAIALVSAVISLGSMTVSMILLDSVTELSGSMRKLADAMTDGAFLELERRRTERQGVHPPHRTPGSGIVDMSPDPRISCGEDKVACEVDSLGGVTCWVPTEDERL